MMLMETQRVTKPSGFTIDISSKTTTAAAAPSEALTNLLRKSVGKPGNQGGHHHGASMNQYSNNLMQGKQQSLNERGSSNSQTRALPSSRMPSTVHPTHRPQNSTKNQYQALLDQASGSPKM